MGFGHDEFVRQCLLHGADFVFHREDGGTNCPCLTPQGFRDPIWHQDNPFEDLCNEMGKLNAVVTDLTGKGFVQPISSSRGTRLSADRVLDVFGEVQADDHIGILPVYWRGTRLQFEEWSDSGAHWVGYNGRRFTNVNANLIPGPEGEIENHWEIQLRLITKERALA